MIVLNKKRIIFLVSAFMFAVTFVAFNRIDIRNEQIVFTSSVPVSGYTVILDAGHGEPDRAEQQMKMVYLKKR